MLTYLSGIGDGSLLEENQLENSTFGGSDEPVEEADFEFDQLLAEADRDPSAQLVYQETMQRAKFLSAGPAIRKKKGLSQKDLAALMGTSQSAVSDLESGRVEPQLRTLQRYARALGHRFDFGLVDQDLPPSVEGASSALLRETALSPLLTALVRQPREQARTLQALADSLLLPTPVIGPMLNLLQAEGWTKSVGEGDEKVYSMVDKFAYIIGVSLERDRIAAVLMTTSGGVIRRVTEDLSDSTRGVVIPRTAEVVKNLFNASDRRVLGVGVVIAGVVDAETGRVDYAPDLQSEQDSWAGVELERELQGEIQQRIGIDTLMVAVENDANALAAWEYSRRKDESVAVALLSGTGFGAGFVLDGKLIHGAHSAAGEYGHTLVDPTGPGCRAGLDHQGCLETMTSVQGILAALGIPAESLAQRSEGLAIANDRVRNGDSGARDAFFEAGKVHGRFLATTIILLDPARVVIYAHPYLADKAYDCGSAFQDGVQFAIDEAASSRLSILARPRHEWQPLDDKVRSIAAGATGLWYFLKRPTRWAPTLLAPTAERVSV